jgi:hypothetical protein
VAREGHNIHILPGQNHILSYSGTEEINRGLGVAVVVDWSMKRDVFDFKAVSERMYVYLKDKNKVPEFKF